MMPRAIHDRVRARQTSPAEASALRVYERATHVVGATTPDEVRDPCGRQPCPEQAGDERVPELTCRQVRQPGVPSEPADELIGDVVGDPRTGGRLEQRARIPCDIPRRPQV